MTALQQSCQDYISTRTSDYAFRCVRFSVVASRLYNLGLRDDDPVVDLGAGRQDFNEYLRHTGWHGVYCPVDGGIDGTDLNFPEGLFGRHWDGGWVVAIEIVEHLHNPLRFLNYIENAPIDGAVLTTPNPETVDVLGCDPAHLSFIPADILASRGWDVEERGLFGNNPRDTLVAWHGGTS